MNSSVSLLILPDEPHHTRRKEILQKHPEMRELFGPDIRLLYCVLGLVGLQLFIASKASQLPNWAFWLLAYVVGGTANHALSLANHELSHNLCFRTPIFNEFLGLFANLAHGVPSAITFKRYHLEHHHFQGVDGVDTDIPTEWEGRVFNNTGRKIVWCLLQPLFYAIRPICVKPLSPKPMELLNFALTFWFDYLLVRQYGVWSLAYLIMSTLLGMGLHPVAGHFIAEHYQFILGQETYSYYGILNYFCFNVGYHNEHHDFPRISGFHLPRVRDIAPEYYDERWKGPEGEGLVIHDSWVKVIYDYITMSHIGPFSRVKRAPKKVM